MAHVTVGCRDCKKCTNSGVANAGRNWGRLGAGVLSVGMSEVVMAGTKNCRVCGHKLSLHTGSEIQTGSKKAVPAGWYLESGRMRWWDGSLWGQYQDDVRAEPAPLTVGDPVSVELERLASLHERGVLSADEFAAAKKRALGI